MLFDPDPRNLRHLRYCSAGSCRKTSKAASQTRWPSQAQNRNHFRGPEKPTTSNRWISYNFTPLIALWNLRENRFRARVIELAKALVPPCHSMIPLDYSPKRHQRYERYVTARYGGLTKAGVGLTHHAFRHESLSVRAEGVSNLSRPLRRVIGLDREAVRDRVGRQVAAIDAGHHDTYTTEIYYGSRTEKAPQGVVRELAESTKGPVDQPLVCRDVDGNLVGGKGRRIRVLDKPPEPKG